MVASLGEELLASLGDWLNISVVSPRNDATPAAASTPSDWQKQDLVGIIRGGLAVKGGEKSQIVHLTFDSTDPEFAADVVNATSEAYIEMSLDASLGLRKSRRLLAHGAGRGLAAAGGGSEAPPAGLSVQREAGGYRAPAGAFQQPGWKRSTANSFVPSQRPRSWPSATAPNIRPWWRRGAEVAELNERLQAEKNQAVSSQEKSFILAKLERDVATNRQLYEQFLTKNKESDIASQYDIDNVRVIDRAMAPAFPYKPNRQRIVIIYLIGGLAIGVLLAWLREHIDNTYKTPEDVENHLGSPVLGVVPLLKKPRLKGRVVPERHYILDPRSSFAESVNHIRTSILFSNFDKQPQIILATSAVQGEGKTTLSTNLSLAFSPARADAAARCRPAQTPRRGNIRCASARRSDRCGRGAVQCSGSDLPRSRSRESVHHEERHPAAQSFGTAVFAEIQAPCWKNCASGSGTSCSIPRRCFR